MSIHLVDALLCRRNELAALLIECVIIDPPGVMPMLDRVKLTGDAGVYLAALNKRRREFLEGDDRGSAWIALDAACEVELEETYFKWLARPVNHQSAKECAQDAIAELERLDTTAAYLVDIAGWVSQAESMAEYRNVSRRSR